MSPGASSEGGGSGGEYLAPAAAAEAERTARGSRFLALVRPAADAAAAAAVREEIAAAHPDASHHCWAERIGHPARERSSDAGEPAGTAGEPILRVLAGRGLSDVVAVVVRWFGGVKLGKGGLARAYAGATREALEGLRVERRFPTVHLALTLPYDRLGAVERLLRPPRVRVVGERYGAEVELLLAVAEAEREAFEAALADLHLAPAPAEPAEP